MKFILTKELGRLAKWLRIIGYDTVYYDGDDKAKLVILSLRDNRIILTRDSKMARFTGVKVVHFRDDEVEKQLEQAIKELNLEVSEEKTFTLCVDCNRPLCSVEKERIKNRVPPYVFKTQNEFKLCPACDKVFWKGTHWDLVKRFLKYVHS